MDRENMAQLLEEISSKTCPKFSFLMDIRMMERNI